jgi:hypothetical protein
MPPGTTGGFYRLAERLRLGSLEGEWQEICYDDDEHCFGWRGRWRRWGRPSYRGSSRSKISNEFTMRTLSFHGVSTSTEQLWDEATISSSLLSTKPHVRCANNTSNTGMSSTTMVCQCSWRTCRLTLGHKSVPWNDTKVRLNQRGYQVVNTESLIQERSALEYQVWSQDYFKNILNILQVIENILT